MYVAIDKDGTLTSHPKEFRELMLALKASGHTVIVLIGATGGYDRTAILNQLEDLGVERELYNLVVCTGATVQDVAKAKGKFCLKTKVDMIFEDSPMYLAAVREISPDTICFQILPVGGP